MKSRKATKEEKEWLDSIENFGCIVCANEGFGYTPSAIHHIDGKVKPDCHFKTLPLCGLHHQGENDTKKYTPRHPWKKRFEARYGTESELLNQVKRLVEGYFNE